MTISITDDDTILNVIDVVEEAMTAALSLNAVQRWKYSGSVSKLQYNSFMEDEYDGMSGSAFILPTYKYLTSLSVTVYC